MSEYEGWRDLTYEELTDELAKSRKRSVRLGGRIAELKAKVESLTSENTRLRALLRVVAEEDLDADAADGVTVLQAVIKEARYLLAIKEKIE